MRRSSQRYEYSHSHSPVAHRGVALLLVLVLISLGSILAMRFLQVAATRSTLCQDYGDAKKAELLAESGISEAAYWFQHSELTGGTLWNGVASRRPDITAPDYYKVTVAQTSASPARYMVTSEGHVMTGTADKMVRTTKAEFSECYGFSDAVTAADELSIPPSVTILGSVYSRSRMYNRGYVDGNVALSGFLYNSGTIKGRVVYCWPRPLGSYPLDDTVTYSVDGTRYTAKTISSDSNTNKTWSSSTTNPMGVWYRKGSLHLGGTTIVNGTLVVQDNLTLNPGSTTIISPKPGFPALVVNGFISLENGNLSATINGSVLINRYITTVGNMSNASLTIKGALVFTGNESFPSNFSLDPIIIIQHDPTRTDISGLYPAQSQGVAAIVQTGYFPNEP